MPKTRKTREEKARSAYRLQNFKLSVADRESKKDANEFGYLSREYVRGDLLKTVFFSVLMIGLLFAAKRYLG